MKISYEKDNQGIETNEKTNESQIYLIKSLENINEINPKYCFNTLNFIYE